MGHRARESFPAGPDCSVSNQCLWPNRSSGNKESVANQNAIWSIWHVSIGKLQLNYPVLGKKNTLCSVQLFSFLESTLVLLQGTGRDSMPRHRASGDHVIHAVHKELQMYVVYIWLNPRWFWKHQYVKNQTCVCSIPICLIILYCHHTFHPLQ